MHCNLMELTKVSCIASPFCECRSTTCLNGAMAGNWICAATGIFISVLLLLYLTRLNCVITSSPPELANVAQKAWRSDEIRARHAHLLKSPPDYSSKLPPRLNRRYIVVGGCGLVGGTIVSQLLQRGQGPEEIRIVDIRRPVNAGSTNSRSPITGVPISNPQVSIEQADVTSLDAVERAFSAPWCEAAHGLPLTVFHTAAVIVPADTSQRNLRYLSKVNVDGVRNVLMASKKAGASVFVYTSSASINLKRAGWWMIPPWRKWPADFWQVLDESDFDKPLKPGAEYYANYPLSKAIAERLVAEENSDGFRTGSIRPANGIYGHPSDNPVGWVLTRRLYPT